MRKRRGYRLSTNMSVSTPWTCEVAYEFQMQNSCYLYEKYVAEDLFGLCLDKEGMYYTLATHPEGFKFSATPVQQEL